MTESVITTSNPAKEEHSINGTDGGNNGEQQNKRTSADDTDDASSSYVTCLSDLSLDRSTTPMVTANSTLVASSLEDVSVSGMSSSTTPKLVRSSPATPQRSKKSESARSSILGLIKTSR